MSEYVIFADSACDLSPEILNEWGVRYQSLTFHFEGEDREYGNGEMPAEEFYGKMRSGAVAKTSAINMELFRECFEECLKEGKDVLYLGFSSGLSATCQSGMLAAEELKETYPERRVVVVDSLAASAGYGLLLHLAVEKKRAGATLEETARFLEDNKLNLCHWFTVEDLKYLKRGGRVSPAVAFVGGMLGIKPVMHVDDEGHLVPVDKVRGRRASLEAMANKYMELAQTPGEGPVYISHGDCMADVETLKGILRDKCGAEVELVTYVGPVIGAHSGPGTMALFFLGKHR